MYNHHPKKNGIILFLFLSIPPLINAQYKNFLLEAGVSAGTFIYQGDLTPSAAGSFNTMKPGINLFVSKKLNSSFTVRTNLAFSTLYGDDSKYTSPAWRQQRNLRFKTSVIELSEFLQWDPTARNFSVTRTKWSPYLFAGAGLTQLNIRRDWSQFNASWFASESNIIIGLEADAKKSLPAVIPVFPVGAGLRYSLTKNISLNLESMYRFTKIDYLEGFSQSANPSKGDHYWSNTIGVIFSVGKASSWKCPKISD